MSAFPLTIPMPSGDITALLDAWRDGREDALGGLVERVYDELRKTAEICLRDESDAHTVQPTMLVNETFLRLRREQSPEFENRRHFFWFASRMMRRILIEMARSRNRLKRGGGSRVTPLAHIDIAADCLDLDRMIELDEALTELARLDARYVRIIELRFFAGMDVRETAELLGISPMTVKREWAAAKQWLARALSDRGR